MSRDYRAKRLARKLRIPYAEALRRIRESDTTVEKVQPAVPEQPPAPPN